MITAVDVISSELGNAPMRPELLAQIPADHDIARVTIDAATPESAMMPSQIAKL